MSIVLKSRAVNAGGMPGAICAGLIMIAACGSLRAEVPYVEPKFAVVLFNVDALSIDEETRDGIVEALAVVARNFPHEPAIDNAIRMKALAVALRLDSMNPEARLANDELMAGRVPPPLAPPRDASEIAGALWDTAARLNEELTEAEDAELVPFLVELAIAIDPVRRAGAAEVFGAARTAQAKWRGAVMLPVERKALPPEPEPVPREGQEVGNQRAMGRENPPGEGRAADGRIVEKIREAIQDRQGQGAGSLGTGSGAGVKVPAAEFKRGTNALGVVVFERTGDSKLEETAVSCRLTLAVTDGERLTAPNPFFCEEGIDLPVYEQLQAAAKLLMKKYPALPAALPVEKRLDFQLTAIGDGRRLRMSDPRLGATALFLMESLMSGVELDPGISVGGALPGDEVGAAQSPRWWEVLEAAAEAGVTMVIVGSKAEAELMDHLVADEALPLLRVQVLGLDAADAIAAVLDKNRGEKTAEAAEAMEMFGAIQKYEGPLTARELVTNAIAQERLEAVLELFPAHLSAKLLLAYGKGNVPERLSLAGSVRQVESHMKRVARAVNPADTAVPVETQDSVCADSLYALRRMREMLAPEAIEYSDAVVDMIEQVREYLQLSNRATNSARQLAAEISESNQRVEALRAGFKEVPVE